MNRALVNDFLAVLTRDWNYEPADGRARCPGHRGQDRNLKVTIENDKIITYCHSHGCEHKAILAAMGLTYEQAPAPQGPAKIKYMWTTTLGRNLEHYRINTPDGKRMGWSPKGFALQKGEKFQPFARGNAASRTIGVFEGEKTVLAAAAQLGHTMLCLTWGGRKLSTVDWSLCRDKDVVLWPDHDAAGYRQMTEVGREIQTHTPKKITAVLLPAAAYKSDADDYVAQGRNLANMIDRHTFAFTGGPLCPILQNHEEGLEKGLQFTNLKLIFNERKNTAQILPAGGGSNPLSLTDDDRIDYDDFAQAKLRQYFQLNAKFVKVNKDGPYLIPAKFTDQDWRLANHSYLFDHKIDPFVDEYLGRIKAVENDNLLENWAEDLYTMTTKSMPFATWFSRYFFLGIVQRTLKPGCMLSPIPVLIGEENAGKSSLGRAVLPPAFAEDGFADIDLGADPKEFYESIQGRIVVEAPEISGYSKQDQNKIKANLTRQVDTPRLAYGREPVTKPRRVIIFATSNEDLPLMNTGTGNRRFCVIELLGRAKHRLEDYFHEHRDALFAAAKFAFERGDRVDFPDDLVHLQKQMNVDYEASDQTLVDLIESTRWSTAPPGQPGWLLIDIARDLFGVNLEATKFARDKHHRLGKALRKCGFERDVNPRVNPMSGRRVRFWYPPDFIPAESFSVSTDEPVMM